MRSHEGAVGASVKGSPAGAALSGTSFENQNANRDSKRSAPPQQAAVQWREAATTEGRAMRRAAAGASKCSACGEPMRVKRAGRKRDFCSSKCRQAAYRDRAFGRKFGAPSYDPSRALRNAPKNATTSTAFDLQNRRPRDWPIDLVGGHRGGRRLEPDLTANIFSVELRAAWVKS